MPIMVEGYHSAQESTQTQEEEKIYSKKEGKEIGGKINIEKRAG